MPFKAQELDAAAYREALTALADGEAQHRQLAAIRLELERLRLLLERVSKRERLKRESKHCLLSVMNPQPTSCIHCRHCLAPPTSLTNAGIYIRDDY